MKQEFYVTLRVTTESEKKLTEERIKIILRQALKPDQVDGRVEQILVTDVIERIKS